PSAAMSAAGGAAKVRRTYDQREALRDIKQQIRPIARFELSLRHLLEAKDLDYSIGILQRSSRALLRDEPEWERLAAIAVDLAIHEGYQRLDVSVAVDG